MQRAAGARSRQAAVHVGSRLNFVTWCCQCWEVQMAGDEAVGSPHVVSRERVCLGVCFSCLVASFSSLPCRAHCGPPQPPAPSPSQSHDGQGSGLLLTPNPTTSTNHTWSKVASSHLTGVGTSRRVRRVGIVGQYSGRYSVQREAGTPTRHGTTQICAASGRSSSVSAGHDMIASGVSVQIAGGGCAVGVWDKLPSCRRARAV